MKIILVGYPGSQKIVKASRYLVEKYLPDFKPIYLNYTGEIKGWSKFVAGFLSALKDKKIIFALDDYLISGPMDMEVYNNLLKQMTFCAKLCHARLDENEEYPITTQYSIWDREILIKFLLQVNTPWEFEGIKVKGVIFGNALPYYTNSSLSGRWQGVDLQGLNEEDKLIIKKLCDMQLVGEVGF